MHRCLQIDYILYIVAHHLERQVGVRIPECVVDLLNMALTCRTFREPALDALWKQPDDLGLVLRILPERTIEKRDGKLTMICRPSDAEWTRFKRFTQRVRYVSVEENTVDWNSIQGFYPGEQLFPNLRSFDALCEGLSEYFPVLVRPPLECILVLLEKTQTADALATCVPTCAHTLTRFAMDSIEPEATNEHTAQSEALSHAMCSLEKLKCCQVDTIHPKTLEYLGSLSLLTTLDVQLHGSLPSCPLPFPALEHLKVIYSTWQPILVIAFLEQIDSPYLDRLFILANPYYPYDSDPGRAIAPSEIHDIVSSVTKFAELRTFHLHPHEFVWNLPKRGFPILEMLLELQDLRNVWLKSMDICPSTMDIEAIISAWPTLQHLRLGDDQHDPDWPSRSIRFEDLQLFAQRCPDLETLGLRVKVVPDYVYDSHGPPFGKSTSRVRDLYLGPIGMKGDFRRAATFLVCLFPHARVCKPEEEEPLEDPEEQAQEDLWWGPVEDINKMMQFVVKLMADAGVRPPRLR